MKYIASMRGLIASNLSKVFWFCVAYFLGAFLGDFLTHETHFTATLWPPSGIMVGVLLLTEKRYWPYYILAAFPANIAFDLINNRPLILSIFFSVGNTLEPVTGAFLILKISEEEYSLKNIKQLLYLLFYSAVISTTISATIGVLAAKIILQQKLDWIVWWTGDGAGVLIFAPIILATNFWKNIEWEKIKIARVVESFFFFLVLISVCVLVFLSEKERMPASEFLIIPIVLWASFRFGIFGTGLSNAVVASFALWGMAHCLGPVNDSIFSMDQRAFSFQFLVAGMAVLSLSIALFTKEIRTANIKLHENEERFRVIASGSPDHVLVQDKDLRYTFVLNPQLGLTENDMIGKTDHDFLAFEDAEALTKIKSAILSNQQSVNIEVPLKSIDGLTQYFNGTYIPKYDSKGNVDGLIGYFRNVTETRLSDEKLRQSEERFRRVFDEGQFGIVTVRPDFKFGMINRAFCKMTGYSEEELKTLTFRDITTKEQIPLDQKNMLLLESGKIERYKTEKQYIRKDGSLFWGSLIVSAIRDTEGKIEIYLAMIEDVTERKNAEAERLESENRYRQLVIESPAPTLLHQHGKITFANSAALKFFGAKNADELVGTSILDRISLEHGNHSDNKVKNLMEGSEQVPLFEEKLLRLDGTLIDAELTASPITLLGYAAVQIVLLDISERKFAEVALRESEERLRITLELTQIGIWDWDLPEDKWYASPTYYMMLGYTPIYGMADRSFWMDKVHPADKKLVEGKINSVLSRNEAKYDYEARMLHADGAFRWMKVQGFVAERNEKNEVIRLIGIRTDITERKNTEEALRESQLLYHSFIEQLPNAVFRKDPEGRYVLVNSQFCKLKSLTPEDLIGRSPLEIAQSVQEVSIKNEQADKYSELGEDIHRKIMETGESFEAEEEYFDESGDKQYFHVIRMPVFDTSGYVVGSQGILFDITERKLAEREIQLYRNHLEELVVEKTNQLHLALESGGFNYSEWNSDSQKFFFTDGIAKIIDQDPEKLKLLSTEEYARLVYPDDLDGLIKLQKATLNNEIDNYQYEYRVHNSIGDWIWVQSFVTVTDRNEDSSPKKMIELIKDISKRKQDELQLRRALDKEIELSQLKSRFISTTSHEFRTPLTSVLSSAEMIQKYYSRWSEGKIGEHVGRIKNSVSYLTHLLDDILTLNKSESGIISFMPEKVDLKMLCDSILEDTRGLVKENHALEFNYSAEDSIYFLDPKLMTFIISNLLSNALKYTVSNGKIFFGVKEADGYIIIEVKDEGIGIPENDLIHLFVPFHRSENAEHIQGTGLGLSIVKKAVELHNGKIEVDSILNQGTKFLVTFPAIK